MNNSFPTAVLVSLVTTFSLWFRQPVEAQDASRVPSRERPKDPCGSVQRGGTTEWEVIRYRETRIRTPV